MSGMNEFKGAVSAKGLRFGIVVSRFNADVTGRLLDAALRTLAERGAARKNVEVVHVPGAFELPLAARRMAASRKFDAIIALGCVIRGGTPHFEYVAGECARGIMDVALHYDLPVAFGVLTTDDAAQADARSQVAGDNKGVDAALSALETLHALRAYRAKKK
jgi:6,7-dimethyl-8-ribityllumazine synthase